MGHVVSSQEVLVMHSWIKAPVAIVQLSIQYSDAAQYYSKIPNIHALEYVEPEMILISDRDPSNSLADACVDTDSN